MTMTSFFFYPQNLLYFVVAFTNIFIGIHISSKYKFRNNTYFLLFFCSIFFWSFGIGMRSSIVGFDEKMLWTKFAYLGIVTTPVLFLLAMRSLYLKQQFLSSQRIGLLLAAFAILVLVSTDELHHLFWAISSKTPNQWNYLHYTGGVMFWVNTVYQFLIVIYIVLILLKVHKEPLHRSSSQVYLFSIIPPLITNAMFSLGITFIPDYNVAPIGFLFTGPIIAYGLRFIKHTDLTVVGVEQYLKDSRQGLVVANLDGQIQVINPFAERILDLNEGNYLSESELVMKAFSSIDEEKEQIETYQFETFFHEELYYLRLHREPINDPNGISIGNMVILENITELKRITNVAKISQINKIKTEERERIAKELQDGIIQDLYTLRFQLTTALNHAKGGIIGRAYDDIDDTMAMVDQLVKKVNLLYYELDDDSFGKIGLIQALQDQIEIQKFQNEIQIDLVNFDRLVINTSTQRTIYGIVVSILNGILKLSKPTSIVININEHTKNFMIKFVIQERKVQSGLLTLERVESNLEELLETLRNINGVFEFSTSGDEQKLINIQLPRK